MLAGTVPVPRSPPPSPTIIQHLCRRFGDHSCLAALLAQDTQQQPGADMEYLPVLTTASVDEKPSDTEPPPSDSTPQPPTPASSATPPLARTPSAGPASEPTFSEAQVEQMRKPLPFAEFGELHEQALAYMRWRRDEAVEKDAGLAPSPEAASDVRLWRFAVATGFKMGEAATMYLDAISWRRSRGVDAVREALIKANPAFFGGGSLVLEKPMLVAADEAMMDARPRTYFKPVDGGYEVLLDVHGNLVYIEVRTHRPAPLAARPDPAAARGTPRSHRQPNLLAPRARR